MIVFRQRVIGLNRTSLARFASRAQRAIRLQGEVNVLVTNNGELQALNARFRGKHQPTDVLSFPAMPAAANFAGDVAISADLATLNARLLGHSVAEEVKILTLHGLLHLAGYDHERDQGEMARREQQLRRQLGLPQGLIERHASRPAAKPNASSHKRAGLSPIFRKNTATSARRNTR
jgi:probable rRNA maturation factor